MKLQETCSQCGARYSISKSLAGKKLKCKCGAVMRISSELCQSPVQPAATKSKEPSLSGEDLTNSANAAFFNALSEIVPESIRTDEVASRRSAFDSLTTVKKFKTTVPMGIYDGMIPYCGVAVLVPAIINVVLWAFSVNPLIVLLICLPPVLLAVCYAFATMEYNKMVIETDSSHLAIRFIKRLPWACRDKFYLLKDIQNVFVEERRMVKTFLSRAHSNDIETFHFGRRRLQFVYIYRLVAKMKNHSLPVLIATFEDRATADSILEHLQLLKLKKTCSGSARLVASRQFAAAPRASLLHS